MERKAWESKKTTEKFKKGFEKGRGWAFSGIEPRVLEAVLDISEKKHFKRALDLGAGTGRHSFLLLRKVADEVIASDVSRRQAKAMQEKSREHGIQVIQHSMEQIPLEKNSCDLMIHWDVLSHGNKQERQKAISEVHRVLEKDGMLVLSTLSTKHTKHGKGKEIEPNTFKGGFKGEWGEPHHYFTKEELKGLLKDFKIIKMVEEEREFGYNIGGIHWHIIAKKL